MPSLFDTLHKDGVNPLDHIETILHNNDWDYTRMGDNELFVSLNGKFCTYQLIFLWQADMSATQISIQYDMTIGQEKSKQAASTLMAINERAWIGHFEISSDTQKPSFRYNALLNPSSRDAYGQLENIIDFALAQCETNYAAFSILANDSAANDETLPLALMQTQGIS
ncbi:MAG: YbjN domain-containing protein [Bdellovibrionales bacterium]